MSKKKQPKQLEQDIENVNIAVNKYHIPPGTRGDIPVAITASWHRLVGQLQGTTDEKPPAKKKNFKKNKPLKSR